MVSGKEWVAGKASSGWFSAAGPSLVNKPLYLQSDCSSFVALNTLLIKSRLVVGLCRNIRGIQVTVCGLLTTQRAETQAIYDKRYRGMSSIGIFPGAKHGYLLSPVLDALDEAMLGKAHRNMSMVLGREKAAVSLRGYR